MDLAQPLLPPTIKLLADHLDMVLAAGEDLVGLTYDTGASCVTGVTSDVEIGAAPSLAEFVSGLQRYERTAAMRLIAARDRASELAEDDPRFEQIVRLFLGGTHALVDAMAELCEPGTAAFDTARCPVTYLRTRGVLADDTAGPSGFSAITIDEDFRIGAAVPIGALMDLAATFLDSVEIHYEVFPDAEDEAPARAEPEVRPSLAEAIRMLRQ